MKKLLVLAALSMQLFSSCTKVIDINLNKSNPQYIIEAEVTNMDATQTVHITRSVNFSDANSYPAVTNATVIISDDAGNVATLLQDQPGHYIATNISGVPGRTYHLEVLVDGNKFNSSSTMPQPVPMDSLSVTEQFQFGKKTKAPTVHFHEPKGTGHFYYFLVYRNNRRVRTLYFDNDLANDGSFINRLLPDADSSYNTGDKVCVDMQSITKEMYDYYYSLQQTIEQNAATPTNPVTNISGGKVLGYFSAHTVNRHNLILPKRSTTIK